MKAQSIDPQEVAYYDRLADQWWDREGKFWPLHRLNELRVAYLRDEICRHYGRPADTDKPLEGLDILDIGCGGGILSESMAALGAQVHGIDVVEKNIQVAWRHNAASGLPADYEYVTVEEVATRERRYDVVLNMEVVEHVADLPSFLDACSALVKPEGITFIATINRNPLSWLFAIVGAEYILHWLPRGTHQWRRFVKPRELEKLLARNGLVVRDRRGVQVNPLNRKFGLSNRLSVNYMLSAVSASDQG